MTQDSQRKSSLHVAADFARRHWLAMIIISALLVIPCVWHRHIEAGDLGSHVYNAWLAQLIAKGQAPGLYLARQWDNVVFDLMLLKFGNLFGLAAAEKISVYICVLVFFWGVFALVSAVAQRAPWDFLPCLVMLAYGWTFNIGFFNYYLSLGLGFFVTAIVWYVLFGGAHAISAVAPHPGEPLTPNGQPAATSHVATNKFSIPEAIAALIMAALTFAAHPQGFAWLMACLGYLVVWKVLPGWWRSALFVAALFFVVAVRVYCSSHFKGWTTSVVWYSFGPGIYNGSDQIALFRSAGTILAAVAVLFGVICFVVDINRSRPPRESWKLVRLPLELYCILVFGTYILPDVLRVPFFSGWVGSVAIRLTTISAVFGLCVLACVAPRLWHAIGFGVIGVVFFTFLYQDTGVLNRMEQEIEGLVSTLPPGQRVLATIWALPGSRVPYVVHMVDRACIGKCFSYENYEPSTGEFRVRIREESPLVVSDTDDDEAMQSGEYVVQPEDLPMWQIYQCVPQDLTKLCIRPLSAGDPNGRLGYHPGEQ